MPGTDTGTDCWSLCSANMKSSLPSSSVLSDLFNLRSSFGLTKYLPIKPLLFMKSCTTSIATLHRSQTGLRYSKLRRRAASSSKISMCVSNVLIDPLNEDKVDVTSSRSAELNSDDPTHRLESFRHEAVTCMTAIRLAAMLSPSMSAGCEEFKNA